MVHVQSVHEGLRPYKCEYCDATYTQRGNCSNLIFKIYAILQFWCGKFSEKEPPPAPPQKEEKRSTQILSIFHYKPKVLFLNRTALHIARNITKLLSYFFFSFFRQTGTCHFIVTTKIQTNKSNTKQDTTQQKSIIQQNTTQRSKAKQSNTKHINATSKHDKINTNINTTSVTFCK